MALSKVIALPTIPIAIVVALTGDSKNIYIFFFAVAFNSLRERQLLLRAITIILGSIQKRSQEPKANLQN